MASSALDGATPSRKLMRERRIGRATMPQTAGMEMYVPAERGMTRPWLQRAADCRVGGHTLAENDASPYAVPGARADVVSARSGFLVRITAEDADAAREIVRRATDRSTTTVEQIAVNEPAPPVN